MSEKEKDKTKYRVVCINHLGNGATIIDSLTVYEFNTLGEAIDACSKMAKNASENMENSHIEIINRNTYAYINIYKGLIPSVNYGIHPIIYGEECIIYRGFRIEIIDEDFGSFSKGGYIVYDLNEKEDTWYPITVKNTINECIIFIDQFSYTTITFIDSTFDTIEGSKLCLPHQELNSKFKRKIILPVS